MGNIAFFASMFVAGGIGLILFRRSSKSVVLLFSSMLLIDIFLMGTFFGIDKLQKRIEQVDIQTDVRPEVALLSLESVRDNPLLGTGAGTYYTSFPQYRDSRVGLFYRHTHNDYIEFTSELGILGLLPLMLLIFHATYTAVRVQISRRETLMRAMGFSATMAIISILLHSLTDFNLQIFANAATFMFILALPYLAISINRRQSL
jgi:O-antigen ligase